MSAGDPEQNTYNMKYQAGAGANVIVSATPAFLHSIIVGEKHAVSTIEVSDHATDGDGNIVLHINSPAVSTILVDAAFDVGIAVDMTTQTHCTFVWR